MDKISAVVITFNASATIADCLDALQAVSDEIIVIDSFSTDATAEICRSKNALFYQQKWLGYGPQKNFGISKSSNNYILSIDADEIVTEELSASINKEKNSGLTGLYKFRRVNYYYGYFSKHGSAGPEYKIRLFDKNHVSWNEREVHEDLVMDKEVKVKTLHGDLLHYSYASISHEIEKLNNYTTLGAHELHKKGKKYFLFKMIFDPPVNFITNYFVRLGFLDGIHGFVIASLAAHETFVKYAKLWEMTVKEKKIN
jgi:glycosyltransferase involved in cell wall biosynthesis